MKCPISVFLIMLEFDGCAGLPEAREASGQLAITSATARRLARGRACDVTRHVARHVARHGARRRALRVTRPVTQRDTRRGTRHDTPRAARDIARRAATARHRTGSRTATPTDV